MSVTSCPSASASTSNTSTALVSLAATYRDVDETIIEFEAKTAIWEMTRSQLLAEIEDYDRRLERLEELQETLTIDAKDSYLGVREREELQQKLTSLQSATTLELDRQRKLRNRSDYLDAALLMGRDLTTEECNKPSELLRKLANQKREEATRRTGLDALFEDKWLLSSVALGLASGL